MEATHLCGHQGSVRSGGTHVESRNERILERAAEWSAGGWSIKTKRRWTQIEGCRAALRIQPTQKDGCEDEGGCWTLQSQVWLFCFSCFLKGVRLQIEEATVDCVCVWGGWVCQRCHFLFLCNRRLCIKDVMNYIIQTTSVSPSRSHIVPLLYVLPPTTLRVCLCVCACVHARACTVHRNRSCKAKITICTSKHKRVGF